MSTPPQRQFSDLAHFTDKQWEATEASDTHRYTLYGGSRGPGKSYWLRWDCSASRSGSTNGRTSAGFG